MFVLKLQVHNVTITSNQQVWAVSIRNLLQLLKLVNLLNLGKIILKVQILTSEKITSKRLNETAE